LAGPLQSLAPDLAAGWPELRAGLPFGAAWSYISLALLALAALLVARRHRLRSQTVARSTWGCGFPQATARMSYTAGGFAQLAQEGLYCGCLRPQISGARPRELFPAAWQWRTRSADPVLARGLTPLFGWLAELAGGWRRLQGGHMNLYLTYFFAATVLLLGWAVFS
jgi:hypothetical protein